MTNIFGDIRCGGVAEIAMSEPAEVVGYVPGAPSIDADGASWATWENAVGRRLCAAAIRTRPWRSPRIRQAGIFDVPERAPFVLFAASWLRPDRS